MRLINKKFALRLISIFFVIILAVSSCPSVLAVELPEAVEATSAILVEPKSGEVIYDQNAEATMLPASMTKVLTALLVIEAAESGAISLDDKVMATQAIIDNVMFDASKVVPNIVDGEEMTVREYLYCVLLSSDCVACDILAVHVSGSVEAFVSLMNQRAAELGCSGSNFLNTHGYPVEGHYSTAKDIYLICAEAIKHESFTEIFGTIKTEIPATNKSTLRKLYNTNWNLWDPEKITSVYCKYFYEYTTGGKTGSSSQSGHCLVSTAEKDGMTLICVIAGAEIANPTEGEWWNRSFTESKRLYEWGFENYSRKDAVVKGTSHGSIKVKRSEIEEIALVADADYTMTIPKGSENLLKTEAVIYEKKLKAPVLAGDVLGELAVTYDGKQVTKVNLVAAQDAPLKESLSPIMVILIILVAAVAGLLLYVVNSDNPVVLKKYKPKSTYRTMPSGNNSNSRNNGYQRTNSGNYPQNRQGGYSRPNSQNTRNGSHSSHDYYGGSNRRR